MEKLIFDKNMVIKCKKAKWKKISNFNDLKT